jgi:DNA-binding beta-propeller fold protein YncE
MNAASWSIFYFAFCGAKGVCVCMLKNLLKRWLLISLLLLLLEATPFFLLQHLNGVQASQNAVISTHHYFYTFPNGSMNVYDIDQNFALVKSVPIPTINVRGVLFDPQGGMLYFSDGGNGGSHGTGSLIKYNLLTQTIVYKQAYNFGVDSMAITPDGKTIFMPDGSTSSDGTWHIINTATGQVTGSILTASGVSPHDTDMSANGQYVYMEGVNSNVLWVASTATRQIVQKVQPFAHALRPFVVNQSGTLAYTTENGLIGFGVGNLQTGQVLYNVSAPGFKLPPGFDSQYVTPSHGISLSPDGKTVYVVDMPNSYVHVFNVSGLPDNAPTMTASIPINPISGTESPCKIDCAKEGWLEQSLDGRYLFVGNSGSIIDTTTDKVVTNLATLADTRMFLEVDWVNGVPVNSEDRTDFYWNSGPAPTPMPTSVRPQQTKVIPKATAIHKSNGTQPQAPTPNSNSKSTTQPVAQVPAIGGEQSGGKKTLALIAGAIFALLSATLVALVWRRKAQKEVAQPTTPFYKEGAGSLNPAPLLGMTPPAQSSSSSLTPGPSWSDLPDQQTSPSLPVPERNHQTPHS